MSVRKLTASLLTALALLGGVASVGAQEHVPVADPFAFDPDFNWFEPVYDMDLADMKPSKRAATGWFATYDRLHLYGSRPDLDSPSIGGVFGETNAKTRLDSGYGHRYEVGYMLPGEDKGWTFNWTKNEVHEVYTVRRERLNRYNGGQVTGGSGDSGAFGAFGFETPPGTRNNEGNSYRFIDIGDTQNYINYNSYELNKTWRMEPYHYGGILEPLVGLRWLRVNDLNGTQSFAAFPGTTAVIGPGSGDPADTFVEQLTSDRSITENEMLGMQVGFRYLKQRERFSFTSDFKCFLGGSYQSAKYDRQIESVFYDNPTTIGDPPVFIRHDQDGVPPVYERNEEFFIGFDVRGEVGYQLTKMLQIRAGVQVIDIARGLWRGGSGAGGALSAGDNDQGYVMVGGTFGLSLNH
ncbi:hypothetical protein K227x_38730 [Rubripirellula lacrimiformis]|uniref:Uncharacterized protein n=1 Tax=Rubripirellula lacrimiformis TaxID=1930273 RepID=A0A517NEB2_9BACT|nr:hypothetical protein [Rubripirellula lacrimiformis]QDT05473.1 hypothetical protein K227x_38730 [Rubripirellula lacrimiformis]